MDSFHRDVHHVCWAPIFSELFDSYGPKFSLLLGTTFHVFGLMMVSVSTEVYQIFLAQSVCSAIGTSAIFWSSNNSVGTWFGSAAAGRVHLALSRQVLRLVVW